MKSASGTSLDRRRLLTALLLFAAPALALAETGPAARTLTADIPAAGLKELDLRVGVGEVHVSPSPDDQVHVEIKLRQKDEEFLWFFHWSSSGSAKDIAEAAIYQRRDGDTLSLGLDHDDRNDSVKQEWKLELPARLALDADMKVGDRVIAGVAGGVDAVLNVGELDIDVPQGRIKANVSVGDIRAKSGSGAYGRVRVTSNIGDAVLTINGEHSGFHGHSGLGNEVSVDGKGPDDMDLSVNVGEATLRIGAAADTKQEGGK